MLLRRNLLDSLDAVSILVDRVLLVPRMNHASKKSTPYLHDLSICKHSADLSFPQVMLSGCNIED